MNPLGLRSSAQASRALQAVKHGRAAQMPSLRRRAFHTSRASLVVKPFLLADIGEGIREVQIIQWFVQEGARVEQFDKLCEVQSDKASVEITSRFDGVIKKLHYDADDMAEVGKPLVDIDIQGELSAEDEALTKDPNEEAQGSSAAEQSTDKDAEARQEKEPNQEEKQEQQQPQPAQASQAEKEKPSSSLSGKHATLATPAVRRLTKELDVDIAEVPGSGKDGRVFKEDVQRFADSRSQAQSSPSQQSSPSAPPAQEDRTVPLTPTQAQMFKTMTRSLSIPHFLYSDSINTTALNALRKEHNSTSEIRLSVLPFLVKAVSLAMLQYPLVNARVDSSTNPEKPQLVYRGTHNIGIACDTPQGLLVPVIKNVQSLTVADIAAEAKRLASIAREGKLTTADMSGGTFTVSNIGSIGGGVLAPVIVDSQVAIVGLGRTKAVPAFDEEGNLVKREECTLSWSADHRVLDGATVARCAEVVKKYIESPGTMLVQMR